jgi:hypothetical protein
MSSYTKATNFASKDALALGNPLKIVKGTEIDNEFNAIATAVNSKIEGYNALLTGVPTATTAAVTTYTTQVATTAFVHDVLPKGIIMLWSGSSASIPAGWALCNGSSSTPDLRDRFVVGAGTTYAVAATGGTANAVVVSHTHTKTISNAGSHNHYIAVNTINGSDPSTNPNQPIARQKTSGGDSDYDMRSVIGGTANLGLTSTAGDHTHSLTIDSAGVSGTNQNLPPYYALCYIMKTTGI